MKIARFEFAMFGINTYAVYDPDARECAIIDPGMSSREEREDIAGFVRNNSLRVTDIINTHLHIDHAIGNAWAVKEFGVAPSASPADLPLGERMKDQARMFGIPEEVEDVSLGHELKDGDVITIGSGRLQVLAVPGHSPGGIALYDAADGFLISGDSLFAGSIGRTDLPGGNYRQLVESVRRKLLTLPQDTVVYPGHGPATTIGKELRDNPFLI